MTKKYSTKKALIASVLTLVLCFSMLIGTTFAWFTDSVTSANNIITSGNLDIELEYWNGTNWVDVAGKSDILTNTKWEPGVAEVAYLRVANAGSLALKYQLGVNIVSEKAGVNVAGEEFKLSDYIQFGVVENVNGESGAYANREAAVAAVTDAKKISAGYTKADSMTAGTELYLALVVWMPTNVGNVANHNGVNVPKIELGINVVATQNTYEEDSFGPDYDEDAWVGGMQIYTAEDLVSAVENGEKNIQVPRPYAQTKYSAMEGLAYLNTEDVNDWPNVYMAMYYGADTIIGY
jgi:predicted ribosomally synthesized peptide with SipW-like signal peptide